MKAFWFIFLVLVGLNLTSVFSLISVQSRRGICENGLISCPGNGKCIPESYICDKDNDCGDLWDEQNCDQGRLCRLCEHECNMHYGTVTCKCRDGYSVGDDKRSCNDVNECEQYPDVCDQKCENKIGSFDCECFDGYKKADATNCTDINECTGVRGAGSCHHECENTIGHYNCKCQEGYRLQSDLQTCKAESGSLTSLLYASGGDVYGYSLRNKNAYRITTSGNSASSISSVYFDENSSQIIWLETGFNGGAIFKKDKKYNPSQSYYYSRNELLHSFACPVDMDVDYANNLVYVIDVCPPTIFACSLNVAKTCVPVITENINEPVSITLDPFKRVMYWVDWGFDSGVFKANMDGSDRTTLFRTVQQSSQINIDPIDQKLYYINLMHVRPEINVQDEGEFQVIHSITPDDLSSYSLTIFEDKLYYSNGFNVKSCVAQNCPQTEEILFNLTQKITAIRMRHPVLQPAIEITRHPCTKSNCSHICLPDSNDNFNCFCPKGLVLVSENKCVKNISGNETCNLPNLLCDNGLCLPKQYLCDGVNDCDEDENDELCNKTIDSYTKPYNFSNTVFESYQTTDMPSPLESNFTESTTTSETPYSSTDIENYRTTDMPSPSESNFTELNTTSETIVTISENFTTPVNDNQESTTPYFNKDFGNDMTTNEVVVTTESPIETESEEDIMGEMYFRKEYRTDGFDLVVQMMRKIETRQDYFEHKILKALSKVGVNVTDE